MNSLTEAWPKIKNFEKISLFCLSANQKASSNFIKICVNVPNLDYAILIARLLMIWTLRPYST